MLRALDRAVAQLAALLLLGGLVLIGASLLGLGATPVLFGALMAVTVALYLARGAIPRVEPVADWALADLGGDLWLASLVAAAAVVVVFGATPGEVQSMGGLVGLAGVLAYVLRPFVRLLGRLWFRVTDRPS